MPLDYLTLHLLVHQQDLKLSSHRRSEQVYSGKFLPSTGFFSEQRLSYKGLF